MPPMCIEHTLHVCLSVPGGENGQGREKKPEQNRTQTSNIINGSCSVDLVQHVLQL